MDPLETIRKLGQKCLEGMPVIVLGCGASAQYGVRGMGPLQQHLLQTITPIIEQDKQDWESFKQVLSQANDLETTLQQVTLREFLLKEVVKETRSMVLTDDLRVFSQTVTGELSLCLVRLLRHLFNSTHKNISIVTTNYDRLAEYAADVAGFDHYTGFSQGYFRSFGRDSKANRSRAVEIWKVHGSLDWFHDADGIPKGLPDAYDCPESFVPLLVTPGISKYEITHQEPFRSIIARADLALANAGSYLCVGYGFNDSHIQPKLIEKVQRHGVPIVILARTLTGSAKEFLANCKLPGFLALECREHSTRAYFREEPGGIEIPECSLWEFGKFLDETIL